jgi:uncharacterized delta-60 repeat protein
MRPRGKGRSLLGASLALAICGSLLAFAAPAIAAPGDLDRSFGNEGLLDLGNSGGAAVGEPIVIAVVPGPGNSSFILNAGLECVGGQSCRAALFVIRNRADGFRDKSFGDPQRGARVLSGLTLGALQSTMAVDDQGRPIVVVHDGEDFVITRLDTHGDPDSTFGVGGKVTIDCGCEPTVEFRIAIDADGRIVIFGQWEAVGPELGIPPGIRSFPVLMARLLPSGSLDPSFGSGGMITSSWGASSQVQLALETDGTVALARRYCCGNQQPLRLERFHANGEFEWQLDLTDGLDWPANMFSVELVALLPLRNGAFDLVGRERGSGSLLDDRGFLLQIRRDGKRSKAFGGDGFRWLSERPESAALDARGRIVSVESGEAHRTKEDIVVHRLLGDGRRDRTFGGDGEVRIGGFEFGAQLGIAVQPSQRLLVVRDGFEDNGCRSDCNQNQFVSMLRFMGGDSSARCLGHRATIVGTRRSETLVGTPHRDVIAALGGNDTVRGGGGNDLICGGAGRDHLNGGSGRDRIKR